MRRVGYTEVGRRASFSGTVVYRAVVGIDGVVQNLDSISGKEFLSRFMQLEQFEACVRRWSFQDSGEYLISFIAGTHKEGTWEIRISAKEKLLTVTMWRE